MDKALRRAADRVELTWYRSRPLVEGDWYATARALVEAESRAAGIDPERGAAIASALSPRMRWERVVLALPAAYRGTLRGGFYGRSIRNAGRILEGEPIGRVLNPDTAPKTWDFHRAILGDPVPVVDVWASRVCGIPVPTPPRYRLARLAYVEAANRVSAPASQVQAVTWEGVRDHGVPVPDIPVPSLGRVTRGG